MPPLTTLLAWADAYWYALPLIAGFIGFLWKLLPLEKRDAFEREFPRLVGLVRLVYKLGPDVVGAWLTLRAQLVAGQPKRKGFARLSMLVPVAIVCFVAALALQGCPPWERPACGSPRSYQCVNDQPHVCSPSQRLTPIGDQPCAAIGGVCALDDAGVAHCMAGGAP